MDTQEQWVDSTLASLDPVGLAGQMLGIGFEGTEPTAEVRRWVAAGRVGSIVLFARNVSSPEQLAELTAGLQALSPIPLLFLIDQEGGIVTRLQEPATVLPGQMALAATGDPANARRAAAVLARELRALGVQANLAPVLDIQLDPGRTTIGLRAFGETAEAVRTYALAALSAYREAGILACGKHFPGIGDSGFDSHFYLPTIAHSRERMAQVELAPFQAGIEAGVGMIMTSHVLFPAYDPDLPATLSPRVLSGFLRQELGFKGLISTDALEMKAIADNFPAGRAGVLAAAAGADILLAANGLERQEETYGALVRAIRASEVPRASIEPAVRRILSAKWRYVVADEELHGRRPSLEAVGCEEHRRVARELAGASITLLRDETRLVPLRLEAGSRLAIIDFSLPRFSQAEEARRTAHLLLQEVQARYPAATMLSINARPSAEECAAALAAAAEADVLLLTTRNAAQLSEQAECVQALLATGRPAVVLALRDPFDLLALPTARTCLVSYGDASVSIRAVVRALFGEAPIRGRLPVSLPGLYPRGYGLEVE